MTGAGRPLRFLIGLLGGWATLRAWMLWPVPVPFPMVVPAQAATAHAIAARIVRTVPATLLRVAWTRGETSTPNRLLDPGPSSPAASRDSAIGATAGPIPAGTAAVTTVVPPPLLPGTAPVLAHSASRWSASAWALLRGGTGTIGAAPVSQLGGAQAGVRVAYALDAARRLALTARVSAPLNGQGREAAFGVAWRPTRAPVTLIAEQRVSLEGGRGGPTLFAIAGLNPTPVAAGFRVEAYGEAGAIKRDGIEPFADGAARVAHPLIKVPLRLDLGVGAWGGAQRGASRLDIGPSLGASVPVARHSLRLTLDWRERVAGNARPGSGPALTLGTDF